ncbi:hypothetical protein CBR_g40075 [Chara braunii]|uniref:Protein kinase domain-containing protein n=1 Tax=Chara braunii TaxID=69332 RepID=A0A388LT67_CHABU|nr:hypothetical protein CBR_g40075 [Chara braunii]|eukprot:GBG85433.1 hypothetical protein CBR_g40075 [Chara braunii]
MVSVCHYRLLAYCHRNNVTLLLHILLLFRSTSSTLLDTATGPNNDRHLQLMPRNQSEQQGYQASRLLNRTSDYQGLSLMYDGNFLQYLGNVLENRPDRFSLIQPSMIYAIAVSSDGKSVYYSENTNLKGNRDGLVRGCVVRKAQWTETGKGGAYIISDVAGPWVKDLFYRNYTPRDANIGTDVSSLLLLSDQELLASRKYNNRVSKFNISSRTEVDYWNMTLPLGIVKPLSGDFFYVSTQDRINRVDTTVLSNWSNAIQTIAGPTTDGPPVPATLDATDGLNAKFRDPTMAPQSITRDGEYLYVVEYWSKSVREVHTPTGATRTIGGGSNVTLEFGIPAVFNDSSACIVTKDGCNLFVAGNGRLYWAPLVSVGGDIREINIVAELERHQGQRVGNLMDLFLLDDRNHLFVGSRDGRIFQFQLNATALHNCSGLQATQRNNNNHLILIIGLCVGFAVLGLCGGGLALGMVTVSQRRRLQRSAMSSTSKNYPSSTQDMARGNLSSFSSKTVGTTGSSMHAPKLSPPLAPLSSLIEFSLSTLESAIREGSCVTAGKGGYGHVYRASLVVAEEKIEVAIKVMAGEFSEMKLGQFRAEVMTLGGVRHRNLCKLLGYCTEGDSFMLVYPYISGGSLHSYLHPEHPRTRDRLFRTSEESFVDGKLPLRWTERMSIAKQIAACLRYLHQDTERPIVHRDVKSSNVLIQGRGKKLRAYLSDFGLAKPGRADRDEGDVMTGHTTLPTQTRAGTPGYMPPEYVYESKLTMSSDVFAYGVVLIELLTGLPAVLRPRKGDSVPLYSWARQWEDIDLLFDNDLKTLITPEERVMAVGILELAFRCTDDSASKRPTMHEVFQQLNVIMKGVQIDSISSDEEDSTITVTREDNTAVMAELAALFSGSVRAGQEIDRGAVSVASWVKVTMERMMEVICGLEEGPNPQLEDFIDAKKRDDLLNQCYDIFEKGCEIMLVQQNGGALPVRMATKGQLFNKIPSTTSTTPTTMVAAVPMLIVATSNSTEKLGIHATTAQPTTIIIPTTTAMVTATTLQTPLISAYHSYLTWHRGTWRSYGYSYTNSDQLQ